MLLHPAWLRAVRRAVLLAVAFGLAPRSSAAPLSLEQQIAVLFRPPLADQIALAPDGRHVAYTRAAGNDLTIVIAEIEHPDKRTIIIADEARDVEFSNDKEPARLRFLRWATPNRLVFAPSPHEFPPPPYPSLNPDQPGPIPSPGGPRIIAPILAVDADGQNPRTLVESRDLAVVYGGSVEQGLPQLVRYRVPEILGFPAGDRDHLLLEVTGFNPTELMRVDVHSGKIATINGDDPKLRYIYDWQGHARLAYATVPSESSRAYLYRSSTGKGRWSPLEEVMRRAWDPKKFRVTPENYFGERAVPLGFDFNPETIYIASNGERDTFAVYALDLSTGRRTPFTVEQAHADLAELEPRSPSSALVFDEHRQQLAGVRLAGGRHVTVWRDEELAGLQGGIEARFPQSSVDVLEWTADRSRFLVRITSGTDPGRCYVYLRAEKRLQEITRQAPWLTDEAVHDTEYFEFDSHDGAHLTGYLTRPRHPRLATPPLIVCFAPGFPARPHPNFDPEAQVLASMGFFVVRLNQRGTAGLGRSHLRAIASGVDRAALADAHATIDWVASRHAIDRKRVALFGRGFAGYLAVRGLQLEPEMFRCAVAIDAPLNPDAWLPAIHSRDPAREAQRALLESGASRVGDLSVLRQPDLLTKPVFLVVETGQNEVVEAQNAQLRSKAGRVIEHVEVNRDFTLGLPAARTQVYRQLEQFFNVNLYDFDVKIGPTKEVK